MYLGADNITKYVPATCFIDRRQYGTLAELDTALRHMTESEFMNYQAAGQTFLRSSAFEPWKPKNVFRAMAAHF